MADRVSALVSVYHPGPRGTGPAALTLAERRGLRMLLLACFPEDRDAVSSILQARSGLELPDPGKACVAGDTSLLWQGPNRWLLEAAEGRGADLSDLEEALAERPAVGMTDLSHARSVIRLSGLPARRLLAKGCGLDLEPGYFNKGDCVLTRFSHYAVTLHAADEQAIDLYITRSFARALWEELLDLGAEYGLRVVEPRWSSSG